jgi:hypothetical protein
VSAELLGVPRPSSLLLVEMSQKPATSLQTLTPGVAISQASGDVHSLVPRDASRALGPEPSEAGWTDAVARPTTTVPWVSVARSARRMASRATSTSLGCVRSRCDHGGACGDYWELIAKAYQRIDESTDDDKARVILKCRLRELLRPFFVIGRSSIQIRQLAPTSKGYANKPGSTWIAWRICGGMSPGSAGIVRRDDSENEATQSDRSRVLLRNRHWRCCIEEAPEPEILSVVHSSCNPTTAQSAFPAFPFPFHLRRFLSRIFPLVVKSLSGKAKFLPHASPNDAQSTIAYVVTVSVRPHRQRRAAGEIQIQGKDRPLQKGR